MGSSSKRADGKDLVELPKPHKYYLLAVGIDKYKNHQNLKTAVFDTRTFVNILRTKYGFPRRNTTVLVGSKATRRNIEIAFERYCDQLTEDDKLVVWLAGHGINDESYSGQYYFVPFDGSKDIRGSWFSFADLNGYLQNISAGQVLTISDSCFSGGITRSGNDPLSADIAPVQLMHRTGRQAIYSGRKDQKVSDKGSNGHSLFASVFLRVLASNPRRALSSSRLYVEFMEAFGHRSAKQMPGFDPLPEHDGGEVVFLQRDVSREAVDPAKELTEAELENSLFRFEISSLRRKIALAASSFALLATSALGGLIYFHQTSTLQKSEELLLAAEDFYASKDYLRSTRLAALATERASPFAKIAPGAGTLLKSSVQLLDLVDEVPIGLSLNDRRMAVSGDGRFALIPGDKSVLILNLENGTGTKLIDLPASSSMGFLNETNRYFIHTGSELMIWNISDGATEDPLRVSGLSSRFPRFSSDEAKVAVQDEDGYVAVWGINRKQPIIKIAASTDNLSLVDILDDRYLLVDTVEPSSVTRLFDLNHPSDPPMQLEDAGGVKKHVLNESHQLISVGFNGTFRAWNLSTGELVSSYASAEGELVDFVYSEVFPEQVMLVFRPDGIIGSEVGLLWSLQGNRQIGQTIAPLGGIREARIVDDHLIATLSGVGTLEYWQYSDAQQVGSGLPVMTGSDAKFRFVEGELLIVTEDSKVTVWDLKDGRKTATLAHNEPVLKHRFSHDLRQLALIGSTNATVWSVETGRQLSGRFHNEPLLEELLFHGDSGSVVTLGDYGLRFWSSFSPQQVSFESEFAAEVKSNYFSSISNNYRAITVVKFPGKGGANWRNDIDAFTGEGVKFDQELDGLKGQFSDSERLIATFSGNSARLYEKTLGVYSEIGRFSHALDVLGVSFAGNDERLVSWDESETIVSPIIKETKLGEPLLRMGGRVVSISSGKNYLIISKAEELEVWSLSELTLLFSISLRSQEVAQIRFSPDESRVLVRETDGLLRIWDVDTGLVETELITDTSVTEARFSSDSQNILLWSTFGEIWVWDKHLGDFIVSSTSTGKILSSADYSSDHRLLTGVEASTAKVLVWQVEDKLRYPVELPFDYLHANIYLSFDPARPILRVFSEATLAMHLWDLSRLSKKMDKNDVIAGLCGHELRSEGLQLVDDHGKPIRSASGVLKRTGTRYLDSVDAGAVAFLMGQEGLSICPE